MEVTYDEYLAMLQSGEGITSLENVMNQQEKKRYELRYSGMYRGEGADYNQEQELRGMDPYAFEMRRMVQITQLYNAYRENTHGRIWIEQNHTSMEEVRRVVGPHAGNVFNTGILFLDQETINAVQAIAELSRKESNYGSRNWTNNLSAGKLHAIINELIACKSLLSLDHSDIPMNKLINQTDAAKRAIGKQMGKNIFGIRDYQANAHDIIKRNSSILRKVLGNIKEFVNPKTKEEENKLGNQKIDVGLEKE